ncbi:MAG: hypothetical protein ACJ77K_16150 [Bacteroidia bacterium]|jgi:hypothetical protein
MYKSQKIGFDQKTIGILTNTKYSFGLSSVEVGKNQFWRVLAGEKGLNSGEHGINAKTPGASPEFSE